MIRNQFIEELVALDFWVPWRWEFAPPMKKPTKRPYLPSGWPADITDPKSWQSWETVNQLPMTCTQPCDPTLPVSQTGFTDFGFVLCLKHDYTTIDIDTTDGKPTPHQMEVYNKFNSYSEWSPSGKGVHIWVKGKVPTGKRKEDVELYSDARFMTVTGNILHGVPIQERQHLLNILYEDMGGIKSDYSVAELLVEQHSDEEIIAMARNAANGAKFDKLWNGDWQGDYSSQSEPDFALYDMLAFYSRHREQCRRLFRQSMLGQRDKAKRDDYLDYMFNKSFDRSVQPISQDIIDNVMAVKKVGAAASAEGSEPGSSTTTSQSIAAAPPTPNGAHNAGAATMPGFGVNVNGKSALPGLLGRISDYIYNSASRQVRLYADVGALAFISGITGRSYNVSGTGLNQYMLMLGGTGTGKDAVNSAINRLYTEVMVSTPGVTKFKGDAELVSAQGLVKSFLEKPCQLLIVGEIGKKMVEMNDRFANTNLKAISRVLLQFYSLSGFGQRSPAMSYSDRGNNVPEVESPCLTLIGESVPSTIYDHLDDTMVSDGLLPRFLMFEYRGHRELNNEHRITAPPLDLVQDVANLVANCLAIDAVQPKQVLNVPLTAEAQVLFKDYDAYTTHLINASGHGGIAELWNRAHLKALKLAAVGAVSVNMYQPVIDRTMAMWATNLVNETTSYISAKFQLGEIGVSNLSETRQIKEVCKIVKRYLSEPWETQAKYHGTEAMHQQGVITQAHIARRVQALACFKHDKHGATAALKRSIQTLIDAAEMAEMPHMQMKERFGVAPKAYVISNPAKFFAILDN